MQYLWSLLTRLTVFPLSTWKTLYIASGKNNWACLGQLGQDFNVLALATLGETYCICLGHLENTLYALLKLGKINWACLGQFGQDFNVLALANLS